PGRHGRGARVRALGLRVNGRGGRAGILPVAAALLLAARPAGLAAWQQEPAAGPPAEAPGTPVRLSVTEAVERARVYDETVRLAEAQRDLAGAQVVQARADALPQLSANVGYSRTLASIFDDISFGPPDGG